MLSRGVVGNHVEWAPGGCSAPSPKGMKVFVRLSVQQEGVGIRHAIEHTAQVMSASPGDDVVHTMAHGCVHRVYPFNLVVLRDSQKLRRCFVPWGYRSPRSKRPWSSSRRLSRYVVYCCANGGNMRTMERVLPSVWVFLCT